MTISQRKYDIIIAGGGMIGTSLALALAPLGSAHDPRSSKRLRARCGVSSRVSMNDRPRLSRSSQRSFEAMGLWPANRCGIHAQSNNIHVSDRGRFGFSHIDAEEQGVEALGYVVINRVLGEVLQDRRSTTDARKRVDVLCPATDVGVSSCEPEVSRSRSVDH